MTVQELIEELQKVEDKGQAIYYPFGQREVEISGVHVSTLRLYHMPSGDPYDKDYLLVY